MKNWEFRVFLPALLLILLSLMSIYPLNIENVTSWGYQLQGKGGKPIKIKDVIAYDVDLMVLDYSADGTKNHEFRPSEIADVKASGKIVLAYMSIGEAEDYRFYWNWMPKNIIIEENPDWPGNYKVKYWEQGWKNIIFGTTSGKKKSYLDRIIDQGFDGVYLDIIDAYEFVGPHEIGGNDMRRTAAEDMITFVTQIANYARITRGKTEFLVVPQNAAYIWNEENFPDSPKPKRKSKKMKNLYFAHIDAIGVEDVFFCGNKDENNPYKPDKWVINHLSKYLAAGKTILSVEYLTKKKKVKKYYKAAHRKGYIPLATKRDLNGVFFKP